MIFKMNYSVRVSSADLKPLNTEWMSCIFCPCLCRGFLRRCSDNMLNLRLLKPLQLLDLAYGCIRTKIMCYLQSTYIYFWKYAIFPLFPFKNKAFLTVRKHLYQRCTAFFVMPTVSVWSISHPKGVDPAKCQCVCLCLVGDLQKGQKVKSSSDA